MTNKSESSKLISHNLPSSRRAQGGDKTLSSKKTSTPNTIKPKTIKSQSTTPYTMKSFITDSLTTKLTLKPIHALKPIHTLLIIAFLFLFFNSVIINAQPTPIAQWKLDGTSGPVLDATGNGHDGTN